MKITSIERKTVSYNDKTTGESKSFDKYVVQVEGGKVFESGVGKWNSNWKVGTEITAEESQWQKREWNGNVTWTLKAPASARFGGVSKEQFDALEKRVATLETKLNAKEYDDSDMVPSDIPVINLKDDSAAKQLESIPF